MDLTSLTTIKELFSKYQAKPSKGLGQNFLIDKNILDKIIESANIKPTDFILEVGPGIGTLTQELAQKAGEVVAVEKDETMIKILKETLKDFDNVKIIQGDILKTDVSTLSLRGATRRRGNLELVHKTHGLPRSARNDEVENYKVVANIPYYLTSPLIREMLETELPPKDLVLMLQKEVAQRICAKPPQMSLLAVSVQFYAEAKIVSYVSKNCFWPAPKIDSAIIKITPSKKKLDVDPDLFFKVVKAGFSQPRKQLVNNLTTLKSLNGVKLTKVQASNLLLQNKITPNQRAETLDIKDWINLAQNF